MLTKEQKIAEIMNPVDAQIMTIQDNNEMLMLACGMLQRIQEIFEMQLGKPGAKVMFESVLTKYNVEKLH
jgi:hypothetical protein